MTTRLSLACGSLLMLAGALCAAPATDSFQPLETSVQREAVNTVAPIYRAFVDAGGDNKFTFLVPEGFRLAGDPARGKLEINNAEKGYFITFHISGTSGTGGESHQDALERRFPKSKITPESVMPVLGRNCQAFKVEWKSAGELDQRTCVVYVPTDAGLLEISLTSGAKNFAKAAGSFNGLLGSLTASVNGKLTVHHIDNKV